MLPNNSQILLYHKPVDMRKGINGLGIMIADELCLNAGDGSIFIFYNKHYNKLKMIYWDKNGFCLFYKILSKEKFKIPKLLALQSITHDQLRWLFDGLDFGNLQGFKSIRYLKYY